MPTKKQPNKPATAKAVNAAAPAKAPAAATPAATPPQASPGPDVRAEAIATLVRGGMPYQEAVAAVDRTPAPAAKVELGKDPGADEVIDPDSIPDPAEELEVVEIPNVAPDGYNMLGFLYELRDKLGKARTKKRFRFTLELDQRLTDWLVYAAIGEGQFRKREDLSIEEFLEIKIKELKASDPTGGGRRDPRSSGPRENFNGQTGDWKVG